MSDFLIKTIITAVITTLIGIIIKSISISKIIDRWRHTRIYRFFYRYGFVKLIKKNQDIFSKFIILSKSNADTTKTRYQKKLDKIQHLLHNAVVEEMELWSAIKAGTISPEERAPINELLSVSGTTADFSKRYLKRVGRKRLKCCKGYAKILKKYQKNKIDNYKPIRLQCITNYAEATKKYYELLYSYLPADKRNIIEKAFDK